MAIEEVFPNPTVKQVIFQIRFPNLFYIENKIGEFQLKIMEEFPESTLLHRRTFTWMDLGPEVKPVDIENKLEKEPTSQKIWQFKSPKNFQLSLLSDSLDITSEYHKTYKLEDGHKFRDVIEFVLVRFLEVISLPTISRIGLRYIDECPIPSKENSIFRSYYNSVFPLDRFDLADVQEMDFKTMVKRDNYYLRYVESLRKIKDEYKLILDFDGFGETINPNDCLAVTDDLHELISNEYEKTIKEPVKKYMRKSKEA
jgi:uncharacterized protein (TIGR04255 family)